MAGSLLVVGTGIQAISHITAETRSAIISADKLLYLVADYLTEDWLRTVNSTAEDLHVFYADGKPRSISYEEMTNHILKYVRLGDSVCAAFYGHPGVFATPSHSAVSQARTEGYEARMLPGISAEDCLFAELGIDPARSGCQSFETTDFLLYGRKFDPSCSLILWQVGVIGSLHYNKFGYDTSTMEVLVGHLSKFYPPDHSVVIFEAPTYSICKANIQRLMLRDMSTARYSSASTLYVPPLGIAVSANLDMLRDLHIPEELVSYVRAKR